MEARSSAASSAADPQPSVATAGAGDRFGPAPTLRHCRFVGKESEPSSAGGAWSVS